MSRPTPSETRNTARPLQLLEGDADQVEADAGTFPLDVGHAECAPGLLNRSNDQIRLFAARRLHPPQALLELLVGRLENEQREIDVGPRIVSAVVPASRAQFKRLVISVLVLLDEPAGYAPDLYESSEGPRKVREFFRLVFLNGTVLKD